MMNCQQATRLLSDAQERKLSLKDRAAIKIHVMMCSGCRNFAQQMGALREIAQAYTKGSDDKTERGISPQGDDKDSG